MDDEGGSNGRQGDRGWSVVVEKRTGGRLVVEESSIRAVLSKQGFSHGSQRMQLG